MTSTRKITYVVVAFGAVLALIIGSLMSYEPPKAVKNFEVSEPSVLFGRWKSRTVAEDDLNTGYSGYVVFGKDYYEIGNQLVKSPVRIDNVRYQVEGNQIHVWVEGQRPVATEVTMLRDDRAQVELPGKGNLVLYLYREE